MENFSFFCLLTEEPRNPNDDWRQKYVWSPLTHRRVKVKSLPKDLQWRFAPFEIRLKRQQKIIGSQPAQQNIAQTVNPSTSRVFTVYYSASRANGFDKFDQDKLVMVTDDSKKAIEIGESGLKVGVAHNVPIEAFKKYYNYATKNWESFSKDMDDEEKFELIKWTDQDVYLCDFFKYKAQIQFQLADSSLKSDEDEQQIK